jgi:hypothetical protein
MDPVHFRQVGVCPPIAISQLVIPLSSQIKLFPFLFKTYPATHFLQLETEKNSKQLVRVLRVHSVSEVRKYPEPHLEQAESFL